MNMTTLVGIVAVVALIIGVGIYSGRKVKNAKDFLTGGGTAGPGLVCGAILGSLVGGQSTIGTVQLAFHWGMSAWWFTLGSGLGCLALALGYVRALRASGRVTELQIVRDEFGGAAETAGSLLNAAGIFLTVLAQVMSCIGLFAIMFPSMPPLCAAGLTVGIMCAYVVFGGAWGAGLGGMVKTALLYLSFMGCLALALRVEGGLTGLTASLEALLAGTPLGSVQAAANGACDLPDAGAVGARFFSLISRGAGKDLGSCLSLVLGVLSTQTYAQAAWSARSDAAAKRGVLLGAALCPPLGAAGIVIGLSMRAHYVTAAEVASLTAAGLPVPDLPVLQSALHALPVFALSHLPPLLAGAVLGTLLITVIGGGAGLSLGMATILVKDLYRKVSARIDSPGCELAATRVTIAALLCVAAAAALLAPGKMINDLGFLSMGLRAAVVCAPLTVALFWPGRLCGRIVVASMLLSPLSMAASRALALPVDPLMLGMGVSAALCAAGVAFGAKKGAR